MTDIEQQTLADGFRVLLCGVDADRTRNLLRYRAVLFDGGRAGARLEGCEPLWGAAGPAMARLREFLGNVLAPPHVLALYGRGGMELLRQFYPNLLDAFRILDLAATAKALARQAGRGPNAGPATGFPVVEYESEDGTLPAHLEELLWAVIAAAGARGLDWPVLLRLAAEQRYPAEFARYEFNEVTLACLPDAPGVYVMRDRAGAVLYVGKAARLQRRLADYFRATTELDPKLAQLRTAIRSFEYETVGSELEALLLENRRIAELMPAVNTQRVIAPGTSRYRAVAAAAVAIVAGSARAGWRELFAFGAGPEAIQLSLNPAKPPRARLARLAAFCRGETSACPRGRGVRCWDAEGAEICRRYWARARDRLTWVDLGAAPSATAAAAQTAAALRSASRDAEPAEFRSAD